MIKGTDMGPGLSGNNLNKGTFLVSMISGVLLSVTDEIMTLEKEYIMQCLVQ